MALGRCRSTRYGDGARSDAGCRSRKRPDPIDDPSSRQTGRVQARQPSAQFLKLRSHREALDHPRRAGGDTAGLQPGRAAPLRFGRDFRVLLIRVIICVGPSG
jgi:hypothetical protein